MKEFFVTATDTDAGKTFLSAAIIHKLTALGLKVKAFKPISAGAEIINGKLVNSDAATLHGFVNTNQTLDQVNPIVYREAIAPHIAASLSNEQITIKRLNNALTDYRDIAADLSLIEGAGGWLLPLNETELLSDWVTMNRWPVIFVVDMKLGCLNHAQLTYQHLIGSGLKVAGWLANGYREMPFEEENVLFLKKKIEAPFLGKIPKVNSVEEAAAYIDLNALDFS